MGITNDDLESALNLEASKVKALKKKIKKIKTLLMFHEELIRHNKDSTSGLIEDIKAILKIRNNTV